MRINCKELRKVERLDDKKHSSTNTKEGLLSEVDSVFYTWEGPRPSTIFKAKGRMTDILHARAYPLIFENRREGSVDLKMCETCASCLSHTPRVTNCLQLEYLR